MKRPANAPRRRTRAAKARVLRRVPFFRRLMPSTHGHLGCRRRWGRCSRGSSDCCGYYCFGSAISGRLHPPGRIWIPRWGPRPDLDSSGVARPPLRRLPQAPASVAPLLLLLGPKVRASVFARLDVRRWVDEVRQDLPKETKQGGAVPLASSAITQFLATAIRSASAMKARQHSAIFLLGGVELALR